MKTFHLFTSVIAVSLLSAFPAAHAGFLLETSPAQQQPVVSSPSSAYAVTSAGPVVATPGRNVDLSAPVARMAKMNRQRIDLESRLSSRITQSGEQPTELPVIRGKGVDVTFADSLRQILPPGWSAYSDQDLPLEQQVNWSGNRTWPMVLHELLTDKDMRAHIDWKTQEVMFFVPAPKEQLTKVAVAGAEGVEVRTVAVAAAPAASSSAPVKKTETKIVWTLSPDFTLRENMRRWATAANWNLVWNAVNGDSVIDYPVDAKVEFPGELLGASGAMAKVITAYRDADYPLEIEFFRGNRVVEVRLHRIPDVKLTADAAPVMNPPRLEISARASESRTAVTPADQQ